MRYWVREGPNRFNVELCTTIACVFGKRRIPTPTFQTSLKSVSIAPFPPHPRVSGQNSATWSRTVTRIGRTECGQVPGSLNILQGPGICFLQPMCLKQTITGTTLTSLINLFERVPLGSNFFFRLPYAPYRFALLRSLMNIAVNSHSVFSV